MLALGPASAGLLSTQPVRLPQRLILHIDLLVALDPITTQDCDHRFQAKGHDPGVKLRHLSQVR